MVRTTHRGRQQTGRGEQSQRGVLSVPEERQTHRGPQHERVHAEPAEQPALFEFRFAVRRERLLPPRTGRTGEPRGGRWQEPVTIGVFVPGTGTEDQVGGEERNHRQRPKGRNADHRAAVGPRELLQFGTRTGAHQHQRREERAQRHDQKPAGVEARQALKERAPQEPVPRPQGRFGHERNGVIEGERHPEPADHLLVLDLLDVDRRERPQERTAQGQEVRQPEPPRHHREGNEVQCSRRICRLDVREIEWELRCCAAQ